MNKNRQLTAGDIALLEKVKSPVVSGESNSMVMTMLHYLFVTTNPLKKIYKYTKTPEEWELAVLEWGGKFSQEEIIKMTEDFEKDLGDIDEAQFTVEPDPDQPIMESNAKK